MTDTNLAETATRILNERRLTLAQAAQLLGLHVSTVWRWQMRGVRGVRLETTVLGHVRYTSHEAIERFSAGCTAAAEGVTAPQVRTSAARERAIAQAERELAEI